MQRTQTSTSLNGPPSPTSMYQVDLPRLHQRPPPRPPRPGTLHLDECLETEDLFEDIARDWQRGHQTRSHASSVTRPSSSDDGLELAAEFNRREKAREHRRLTIQELVDTEALFARDISTVCEVYLAHARSKSYFTTHDLRAIFSNVEEVEDLASGFSGVLQGAATDNTLGETFLEMFPRIERVYSVYCSRHHIATTRLEHLEAGLASYLTECKSLSEDHSDAWDIYSLLIKPVQRCLKYPLFLQQILSSTEDDDPSHDGLHRAYKASLAVADRINDYKRRSDVIHQARSVTSSRTSLAKTFARSSVKTRQAFGLQDATAGIDEMCKELTEALETTRSSVVRFAAEVERWLEATHATNRAQRRLVDTWAVMYTPIGVESSDIRLQYHRDRVRATVDNVLLPAAAGLRNLDFEIRASVLRPVAVLLSQFDGPRQIIQQQQHRLMDQQQYLLKQLPTDQHAAQEFDDLSARLLEELPPFLAAASRLFGTIVGELSRAQQRHYTALGSLWKAFVGEWFEACSAEAPASQHVAEYVLDGCIERIAGVSRSSTNVMSANPRLSRTSTTSSTRSRDQHPLSVARKVLYRVEAISSCHSSSVRRSLPILSFDVGDLFDVETEDADEASGGAGWLLVVAETGERGWARTEDFAVA